MSRRLKLTNNSDETDVSNLLSGDVIFSVPYFQRPYKWKPARLRQLENDILGLIDEEEDSHFLGAVIIHGRRSNPSDPTLYEIIDGQQRITTLVLYLCAAVKVLCDNEEPAEAAALFQKYLAIGRNLKSGSNFKLHSCKEDRKQLNYVISDLMSDAEFAVAIGSFKPSKLTDTGTKTGQVRKNFEAAKRFFRDQYDDGGIDQVREIIASILERISVVQIDVWDPTNGPKIFDGLNSRQEPMTVGDLVRNEIFSRVAEKSPDEVEEVDAHSWQPFYEAFRTDKGKNLFDDYFFPYGLIQNSNLNKSEVYNYLRDSWKDFEDPEEIISELRRYQDSFLDLMTGSNRQNLPRKSAEAVRNYFEFRFPSSSLPFLMRLTQGMASNEIDQKLGCNILAAIESFLVRRAICGIEPTGLHSVFRRLWVDVQDDLTVEKIYQEISDRGTVTWPGEEFVRRSVLERPLFGSSISKYVIREYDRSLGGDVPSDIPWIEHVLPQKPSRHWDDKFSSDEKKSLTNTWANLIPLSSQMNINVSNNAYSVKRAKFSKDSMFKSARNFAERFEDWDAKLLSQRADKLADWALRRWSV